MKTAPALVHRGLTTIPGKEEVMAKKIVLRNIPDCPGYKIGTDGSLWSYKKRGSFADESRHDSDLVLLSPKKSSNGYLVHNLRRPDETIWHAQLGRLVLLAFAGDPVRAEDETRHLNGNPTDNRLENLAWGTPKENAADRKRHGRDPIGSAHHNSKLTENEVRRIRQLHEEGSSLKALGQQFGIGKTTIHNVVRRHTWRHVA